MALPWCAAFSLYFSASPIIHRHTLSNEVHTTQNPHSVRKTARSGLAKPSHRLFVAVFHSSSREVSDAQIHLRNALSAAGGAYQPARGSIGFFGNAHPSRIEQRDLRLRRGIAGVRGSLVPSRRFCRVHFCSFAQLVSLCHPVHAISPDLAFCNSELSRICPGNAGPRRRRKPAKRTRERPLYNTTASQLA